eukprot:gene9408-1616_t
MSFSKSLKQLDELISEIQPKQEKQQEKKEKKKQPQPKKNEQTDDPKIIFGRTRIQVSKIVKAENHPNADSLMKCSVDVGDEIKPLVAGIVKSYKPEDILNRLVITIINLKPIKLKGEPSEVMLFASTDINTKELSLLTPPEGSELGDRVILEGAEEEPAVDRITAKQWEKVVPNFSIQNGLPTLSGIPLITKKGKITCSTADGSEFH